MDVPNRSCWPNGLAIGTLHDLVRNGFATADREKTRAGRVTVAVVRLRITDAGRRALGE
jgi:DNA-binding PadR family transcriptional regulator